MESTKEFFLDACRCEECAPSVLVSRLLCCSEFVDYFIRVNDAASNNIQEVISLVASLMRNDAAVYGGRMNMHIVERNLSERWSYLESEYTMMFSVTLMCWYYRGISFLMRIHTNHQVTL